MAMMTTTIVMMTPVDHDIDDRGPNNDRHGGRTSDGQEQEAMPTILLRFACMYRIAKPKR